MVTPFLTFIWPRVLHAEFSGILHAKKFLLYFTRPLPVTESVGLPKNFPEFPTLEKCPFTHNVWLRYRLVKVIKVGHMLVNQGLTNINGNNLSLNAVSLVLRVWYQKSVILSTKTHTIYKQMRPRFAQHVGQNITKKYTIKSWPYDYPLTKIRPTIHGLSCECLVPLKEHSHVRSGPNPHQILLIALSVHTIWDLCPQYLLVSHLSGDDNCFTRAS